jgi:hypothetical protein
MGFFKNIWDGLLSVQANRDSDHAFSWAHLHNLTLQGTQGCGQTKVA